MSDFISNLRNKPESFRIKILWGGVMLCMIIVIGIWFIDLQSKIQDESNDTLLKDAVGNLIEEASISNIKSDIQKSVGEVINKGVQEKSEPVEQDRESNFIQDKAYQLPLE